MFWSQALHHLISLVSVAGRLSTAATDAGRVFALSAAAGASASRSESTAGRASDPSERCWSESYPERPWSVAGSAATPLRAASDATAPRRRRG